MSSSRPGVRCPHQDPKTGIECGKLLYVIANDSWHLVFPVMRLSYFPR